MENKYFSNPGDLTDDVNTERKYFRPAEDLVDTKRKTVSEDKYFRNPGDLNVGQNVTKNKLDEINDYLLTVVSGKKYDGVCELGVLMGSGRMIVSLEQLMKMVDEGYNIVSANVLNDNMIEVEFQKYVYDEEKMERWRRF